MKRLPEGDTGASKHVGVRTVYKILLICIYIYCAFVGLDNKLDKMCGIYIKIIVHFLYMWFTIFCLGP
jgi:hypothetical protein